MALLDDVTKNMTSPTGLGAADYWSAICNGQSAIATIERFDAAEEMIGELLANVCIVGRFIGRLVDGPRAGTGARSRSASGPAARISGTTRARPATTRACRPRTGRARKVE